MYRNSLQCLCNFSVNVKLSQKYKLTENIGGQEVGRIKHADKKDYGGLLGVLRSQRKNKTLRNKALYFYYWY